MESIKQKKHALAGVALALASAFGTVYAAGSDSKMGGAGYGESPSASSQTPGGSQSAPSASSQSGSSSDMQSGSSGASATSGSAQSGQGGTWGVDQSSGAGATGSASAGGSEPKETTQQIRNATDVVKKMESDPQISKLLQQSKGVFIVPQYGRGGLGIAVRGGEGVMLANNNGKWSSPVFYNLGGVSIGAQAGAEIGSIAMILMNEKAVKNFQEENKFSLTADAGLTIVNYTAKARGDIGRGDVIVWSDTKGAFADVAVGVTDIAYDDDENAAFYKSKNVSAKDIISGKAKSQQAAASELVKELSSGGSSGGSSSSGSGESSSKEK